MIYCHTFSFRRLELEYLWKWKQRKGKKKWVRKKPQDEQRKKAHV